jgi:hypothetical protein
MTSKPVAHKTPASRTIALGTFRRTSPLPQQMPHFPVSAQRRAGRPGRARQVPHLEGWRSLMGPAWLPESERDAWPEGLRLPAHVAQGYSGQFVIVGGAHVRFG